MKYLLLLTAFVAFKASAQRDFNYTFYTTKCKIYPGFDTAWFNQDSLVLFTPKKIEKIENIIKICSLVNTADCDTYPVKFLGITFETGQFVFVYETENIQYGLQRPRIDILYVNPVLQTININKKTYYY